MESNLSKMWSNAFNLAIEAGNYKICDMSFCGVLCSICGNQITVKGIEDCGHHSFSSYDLNHFTGIECCENRRCKKLRESAMIRYLHMGFNKLPKVSENGGFCRVLIDVAGRSLNEIKKDLNINGNEGKYFDAILTATVLSLSTKLAQTKN